MTINKATFAKMYAVSRAAVTQAVKSGSLVENKLGHIDESDPANAEWIARRKGTANASKKTITKQPTEKKEKQEKKSAAQKNERTQEKDEDEFADEELEEDYEELGSLSIAKMRADIRFKNEQADSVLQKRMERMGQLVERDLVRKSFAKIATEIRTRFIEFPHRSASSLVAMIKAGASISEVQRYLEQEISQAISDIKINSMDF